MGTGLLLALQNDCPRLGNFYLRALGPMEEIWSGMLYQFSGKCIFNR